MCSFEGNVSKKLIIVVAELCLKCATAVQRVVRGIHIWNRYYTEIE